MKDCGDCVTLKQNVFNVLGAQNLCDNRRNAIWSKP